MRLSLIGNQDLINKAKGPLLKVLPDALTILFTIVLAPVVIKAFCYFIVAPLGARRPPIRLLPKLETPAQEQAGDLEGEAGWRRISSVSLPLTVAGGEEILIHPEYLQSSAMRGAKDTKWLLSWWMPLTSLAAGLYGLTRIRASADEAVLLSATLDPLSEVGVVAIADGTALVFKPRGIVGIVQPASKPMKIRRHWRLFSLHAWLTLQLRFVTFHGPGKLIVKGCRGVRVERVGSGRTVNQAATLGFTASTPYATSRSETFGAYLMGKAELFNDYFAGTTGYFVCEEMPDRRDTHGIAGRGIEGLLDSMLKVFGI